ncbi:DUF2971 domain-containing protein [Microbacterium sp. A1-JK]|uniref:DUF2971 domain-containing protein n=1 Tax=Microbacterium sp. A1-JK TaxID=3177516 RepID=UPI0038852C93
MKYKFPRRSFGEGMTSYALEHLANPGRRFFNPSRAYTVSLSSEKDSLEQWRAYCPRSGGLALGFSTEHLQKVATDQGFILAPCAYDEDTHVAIVQQIVDHHLEIWDRRQRLDTPRQGISSHLVRDLITDVERFAPLLKHFSFAAEREWRLISPLVEERRNEARYVHMPSQTGIRQYQVFDLLTPEHPVIENPPRDEESDFLYSPAQGFRPVIGPNVDPTGMVEAVWMLIPRQFGEVWNIERTASPFK